jgi:hypothetical protein
VLQESKKRASKIATPTQRLDTFIRCSSFRRYSYSQLSIAATMAARTSSSRNAAKQNGLADIFSHENVLPALAAGSPWQYFEAVQNRRFFRIYAPVMPRI